MLRGISFDSSIPRALAETSVNLASCLGSSGSARKVAKCSWSSLSAPVALKNSS